MTDNLNRIVNIVVYHLHTEHNKKPKLFKDTKDVIRRRKLKDRQHNGPRKILPKHT